MGVIDVSAAREWLDRHRDAIVADVAALVEHESPSDDKPALDALLIRIEEMLGAAGARIRREHSTSHGDTSVAEFAGGTGQPALVLAHRDTVFPIGTTRTRPFTIRDDRAYGPGTFDMKAGLALGIWAMRAIRELGLTVPRPVHFLVNADEEVGSPSSKDVIQAHARSAAYALVLEPAKDGMVKTRRKGWGRYQLSVEGRAAHAGADPELGVSAVHEISRQIIDIAHLADVAAGTTVNVGTVRGGTGGNVVAAEAHAEIDCRFWSAAEAARADAALRVRRPYDTRARVTVAGGMNRMPLERTDDVVRMFDTAKRIAGQLGFELNETGTGGVSDGNLVAEVGIPTLDGLGAVGAGAHGVDEYVEIASLTERAALLVGLLLSL